MIIGNKESNNNYKVYESEIYSDSNLKIKQKSIILSNINVKNKIISYEDLIVMGDIKADYLLVNGNLMVTGEINVKEIDVEGSLIYTNRHNIENITVDGEIIFIDKIKDDKEGITTKNLEKHKDFLLDIDNLKNRIIKEVCDDNFNYSLEEIYNIFIKIKDSLVEFKEYSDFIGLLLDKYSLRYDMNLINYLKIINYKLELPDWLMKINSINLILDRVNQLDVNDMIIDLDNEEEINEVKYITYKCKNKLGNKFNEIIFKLDTKYQEDNELVLNKLMEKYTEQASTFKMIEGTIKSICSNKIILNIEDKVDAILTDYYDIGDRTSYKIGDKLDICILNVFKGKDKLDLDVYRNSKKCMYESISKLNIDSLKNIKKSNIEIVNSEELFITNYIGKETKEEIEIHIKNSLLLKNVKILDGLSSNIEKISRIFNVNEDIISEVNNNEYLIKVFDIENYRHINRLYIRYKDLLQNIGIKSVSGNMISIKTKYNLYTNKINKLIEGKVKEKHDNEYIIEIESNVNAKLKYINSNKEYYIDDIVIGKIESISLKEDCVQLNINNTYVEYVKDLIEYKIKELNAIEMINKVDIDIHSNEIKEVKILLNEVYNENIISSLKTQIENNINKNQILFTVLESNNSNKLSILPKEINKEVKSNINKDRKITIWEIIKMFNQKKRECGVPEIRIIKNARVNNYKTILLSSKLTLKNSKDKLLSLEYDMESELKGEKIKIVIYDEDITVIVADMLEIEKNDVEVDKNKRNIKINIEQDLYDNLNIANEKILLLSILPYYKIDFIIKNDNLNKTDNLSKGIEKQENIDDDILGLLFK